MSSTNRTPSPSQLAQLEQAYAKAPAEGWRDLAEVYLSRGRYMEAMVVARRGARALPGDPAPHLVLARVYAAQRKEEKARAAVAEALRLAPGDEAVIAAARAYGLAPAGAPAAGPDAGSAASGDAGAPRPASAEGAAEGSAPDATVRARWSEALARRYAEVEPEDPATRRRRAARSAMRTVALALTLAATLAVIAGVTSSRRARAEEQRRLLADAAQLLEKDSWQAIREAQATCERAAGLSGEAAPSAHGCAAWAAAVRWAEHGEGEPLRAQALEHLGRAGREAQRPRDAVLAGAWLKLHEGDARAAVDLLRARSATDASAPVRAALGVALAAAGDPNGARDELLAAQQLAPGSPRVAQQLADHLRRQPGDGPQQAATLYEIVLQRLAPEHAPSLIGKARLLLDAKEAGAALATARRVAELKEPPSPRQRARGLALEARALASLGRREEAEAAEREARALDGAAPELRDPLARAR